MLPSCQRSLEEVTQSLFISYALNRHEQAHFLEDLRRGDDCSKIATCASLLTRALYTLKRNATVLKDESGLTKEKIAT